MAEKQDTVRMCPLHLSVIHEGSHICEETERLNMRDPVLQRIKCPAIEVSVDYVREADT